MCYMYLLTGEDSAPRLFGAGRASAVRQITCLAQYIYIYIYVSLSLSLYIYIYMFIFIHILYLYVCMYVYM